MKAFKKWSPLICIVISIFIVLSISGVSLAAFLESKKDIYGGSKTESFNPGTLDISSNRYTKVETYKKVPKNRLNLDGYKKILENANLEIWLKDSNASIKIVDKRSGYIWGGLPSDKPENMNKTWSAIGNSLVAIDYFDDKGIERKNSIGDAAVDKTYTISNDVLHYDISFKDLGISFSFEMELKDDSIRFSMLNNSIKETGKFLLGAVYFVPFLGATLGDELDGYMFVPDGPGALIRFNKSSQYLINFEKKVYGKDYAIDNLFEVNDLKSATRPNDFMTEEPNVLIPVFGVVHGVKQNAWFARIENGREYAAIVAIPSGVMTDYNWTSAKFIYRQKYLQPTAKNGAGVQIVQSKRNEFDASISYYFLTGNDADYVGMAKLYRRLLENEGVIKLKSKDDKWQIPLAVDVVGSDIEKGFIFNHTLVVTTREKIEDIINELNKNGISNISLIIRGWQKGGLNGSNPADFSFEDKLGRQTDWRKLAYKVKENGGRFYYFENPVAVNETQINLIQQAGHSLSQSIIKIERENDNILFKDIYFIESKLAAEYIMNKAKLYKMNGMDGMAIDNIGSKLYAENQRGKEVPRDKIREVFERMGANLLAMLNNVAFYRPNDFMWKYSDEIFDIPMVSSQYLFETDTVPFLQIVLKGYIDYYAPYSNMSFYSQDDILRMIEYGAYPSFLITGLSNADLEYTPLSEWPSTKYEDWKDKMVSIYKYVDKALNQVKGHKIDDREVVIPGVVKISYNNGIDIIINYTGSDIQLDNMKVSAKDYAVVVGGLENE